MERFQGVEFLAGANELQRLAGDSADGERRAAAGIAVHFREDDAGDAELLVELVGRLHRVLTGHGVRDEQNLAGVKLFLELPQLLHELLVDVQAAGGIYEENVAARLHAFPPSRPRQVTRLGFFQRAIGNRQLDIARDNRKLLPGGMSVDVDRDHHRTVAVFREPLRQLAGAGRLTGALEADDHDGAGRLIREAQFRLMASQDVDQFVLDDLDDLLRRRQRSEDFLAERFYLDVLDQLLDDAEVNVGLQQRHANLAQGGLHVCGGQLAFTAQALKHPLQFFGQIIEHESSISAYQVGSATLRQGEVGLRAKREVREIAAVIFRYRGGGDHGGVVGGESRRREQHRIRQHSRLRRAPETGIASNTSRNDHRSRADFFGCGPGPFQQLGDHGVLKRS